MCLDKNVVDCQQHFQVLILYFWQMVRHGGCLGLGLAAMGTARQGQFHISLYILYVIAMYLSLLISQPFSLSCIQCRNIKYTCLKLLTISLFYFYFTVTVYLFLLSIYLHPYLSTCCLSTYCTYLPTYLPTYLHVPTYLSVCLSVCLSVYLSIYLSIYLSTVSIYMYLSMYLSTN